MELNTKDKRKLCADIDNVAAYIIGRINNREPKLTYDVYSSAISLQRYAIELRDELDDNTCTVSAAR